MISVDEAHALIAASLEPLQDESVGLEHCSGRVLSEPVTALLTQPPFDASAMDGYAVRYTEANTQGARLHICGVSSAGERHEEALPEGCAIRIFTGAPVPKGADHVIIQENVAVDGADILVQSASAKPGNIRRAGVDFSNGETLLHRGRRLNGPDIGLAAAAGHKSLLVHKRPRVAIIANGDELVLPGETPGPDQIICSIPFALAPLIERWGGEPTFLGIASDSITSIRELVEQAKEYDLIMPIGGASVGDRDFMHTAFDEAGFKSIFRKVSVKPGKPAWFGRMGQSAVLGLPGNPASALVTAVLFGKNIVAGLAGRLKSASGLQHAILTKPLAANGARENYLRAKFETSTNGALTIEQLPNQDSSLLSIMAAANALIRSPANAAAAKAGDRVEFLTID